MATTTNYGWDTPDDTDLVKDGAAAIRTLGSSVDTTTKALNPSTTEGDIEYRSATANTNTRLGIGTAGQVLTVNSGEDAPEWATPLSGGMTLLSTTTLTGASVTLSSIPQTYNDLRIIIKNFKPSTDGQYIEIRVNSDSSSLYRQSSGYADVNASGVTATDTRWTVGQGNDNSVATGLADFTIPNYANTTTWKFMYGFNWETNQTTTTQVNRTTFNSIYRSTNAVSSLLVYPFSGNFTSGTLLLYGVK
jgi:hypothetical protein